MLSFDSAGSATAEILLYAFVDCVCGTACIHRPGLCVLPVGKLSMLQEAKYPPPSLSLSPRPRHKPACRLLRDIQAVGVRNVLVTIVPQVKPIMLSAMSRTKCSSLLLPHYCSSTMMVLNVEKTHPTPVETQKTQDETTFNALGTDGKTLPTQLSSCCPYVPPVVYVSYVCINTQTNMAHPRTTWSRNGDL